MFTKSHIELLEYREDIESYYKAGHGYEGNSRVPCKTVADMLDHLGNESNASPKVIAYFVPATTIQLFLTALGAFNETRQLSSGNFEGMRDRKWKTSEISPFASNLAVVKYRCSNDEDKVKFLLNQKPLELDWCADNFCKLDVVNEKYKLFKEVDCENYYCSGEVKIVYGAFTVVVNLFLIYLY